MIPSMSRTSYYLLHITYLFTSYAQSFSRMFSYKIGLLICVFDTHIDGSVNMTASYPRPSSYTLSLPKVSAAADSNVSYPNSSYWI